MNKVDITIIGAGPYGLSAAAHIRAANGATVRVFGTPMSFWDHHMPTGMFLRSPLVASNLSDPHKKLTLSTFGSEMNTTITAPLPVGHFIEYGRWFQRKTQLELDPRNVVRVKARTGGFRLTLTDNEQIESDRVIVATGIVPFANRLRQLSDIPASLTSHSCDHKSFDQFAGKCVTVVGSGQSALESAALLHEAGAEVSVVAREPVVYFLRRHPWTHRGLLGRILYADPDVGPAVVSQLVAAPTIFRQLPRNIQDRLAIRSIRPAGAAWLTARLQDVPILTGRWIESAIPSIGAKRLKIRLNDDTELEVDHVLQATGYRVDISKYPFLEGKLVENIRRVNGFPVLNRGFESSIEKLHFLGAPAAWSFGPLMRFVAGVDFASSALVRHIYR